MFSFRTLGSLELESDSGHEVTGLLASQKLVALLTYLAVATPRGLHRRDSVIGLLWPELNQERARAALRHSTYRLRGLLGSGAIVSRGDEDIGIDKSIVECDAVRFEELLEAGSVADAFQLYEGDLLTGFFVRGAPEFERWLDGERTRLRKRASDAACRQAETLAANGVNQDAGMWARRAMVIAPDDEQLLRRMLLTLADLGDRAGALSAYESFAHRLREEYEATPSRETLSLAAALRSQQMEQRSPDRASALPQIDAPTPQVAGPLTHAQPQMSAEPRRGLAWRNFHWLLKGGLLAACAALIGAVGYGIIGAENTAGPRTIAVLPFEVRGSPDLDYLREGMSDLLSIGVDGAGGLHSTDPRAVLSIAKERSEGSIEDDEAREIARLAGAGLYITGSVVEAGGRITITASLYDREGKVQSVARTRSADKSELFDLVDELARELLAVANRDPGGLVTLAARTTKSIPALKSFLDGERELRAGRHSTALDAFRNALAEDSTFALAYYRLSSAGRWTTEYALAQEAAGKALHFGDRLPPYARRLLEAASAMRDGAYAKSESLFVASTRSRPSDADAWFGLGDLQYHFNALRGRPKGEARFAFERALDADPGHGESRLHLLELAAWDGRVAEVDSLLAGLPPGNDFQGKWPLIRALITRDRLSENRALAELQSAPDRAVVRVVIHSVTAFPQNLAGAKRVTAMLTDKGRGHDWRAYGHHLGAQIELARGRWNATRAELTTMGSLEPAAAIEYGAMLSLSPSAPITARELGALRAALSSWNATPTPPSANPVFGVHNGKHAQLRLYLLGLTSARIGDTTAAMSYADSLATVATDSISSLISTNLARAIRARVIRRRGDARRALAELGQPWIDPRTHRTHYSSILGQVADRFLMAELLYELDRLPEAVQAYASVGDYSLDGLPYTAMTHLRRGDVYLKMGNRAKAAEHYARFVHDWRECDQDLKPLRAAVEQKLAQLRARGG